MGNDLNTFCMGTPLAMSCPVYAYNKANEEGKRGVATGPAAPKVIPDECLENKLEEARGRVTAAYDYFINAEDSLARLAGLYYIDTAKAAYQELLEICEG